MATIKTPFDWVALARGNDKAREVLTGYNADETHVVATDSFRLHLIPRSLADAVPAGLRDPKTLQAIEGTYPNWRHVMPGVNGSKLFETYVDIADADHLRAMAAAAVAANKEIGAGKDAGYCYRVALGYEGEYRVVNPRHLLDALRASEFLGNFVPGTFSVGFGPGDGAIHLRHSSFAEALLMPVRGAKPEGRRAFIVDVTK